MAIIVNSFEATISPLCPTLPYLDYPSWEASTLAKRGEYSNYSTWRYETRDPGKTRGIRLVFLGGSLPDQALEHSEFDLAGFPRIGALLIEDAVASHLQSLGFLVEETGFGRLALRPVPGSLDDAVELATGLLFSARRPFREESNVFALSFNWEVRALFRESLAQPGIASIAPGMAVLYKPKTVPPPALRQFQNRYIGRVRSISQDGIVTIAERESGEIHKVPAVDLKLEASPAVIKLYEQRVRSQRGPSPIIRRIQQLKRSFTPENRRNLTALRDRLEEVRRILSRGGASSDQLVVPLASSQPGSVAISLLPTEATLGDSL